MDVLGWVAVGWVLSSVLTAAGWAALRRWVQQQAARSVTPLTWGDGALLAAGAPQEWGKRPQPDAPDADPLAPSARTPARVPVRPTDALG